MRRPAFTALAAAAALLGGIASVVASAPSSSAAALPALPQSTRQLLHAAERDAGAARANQGHAAAPGASVSTQRGLFGDSCASKTMCLAVGFDGATLAPTAEVLNGGGWSQADHSIPVPGGTTGAYLQDVSCRPSTFCVAVGAYQTGTAGSGNASGAGLAETWNGSAWSDAADLTPAGADTGLTSVSCPPRPGKAPSPRNGTARPGRSSARPRPGWSHC
jgi:hypothetical protein